MSDFVIDLPPVQSIAIEGQKARFPIHRIFCVGRNYAAHAAEMGNQVDRETPFYFTKSPQAAVASGSQVPYAQGTQNLHYEMEFAVLLGATVSENTPQDLMQSVFGYCAALDMTRRDLQAEFKERRRPWDLAKDFENSAVFAPATTAQAFGPVSQQRIHLSVNGQIKQDAALSDMIHDVPAILSHLSGFYTLGAGDVILTGTPAGVGPVQAGDQIHGGIDGLAPIELTLI